MILHEVKIEFPNMAELIEINRPEFVVKNLDDFFLREAWKTKGYAHNFWGNFTYNVILLCQ